MKKILSIGICMLLFVTSLTVTGIENIEDKNTNSCGIFPGLNSDLQDLKLQQNQISIPIDILGRGKTAYGEQAYPDPHTLLSFDLDDPGTLDEIGSPTSSDFLAGGTWVAGTWWGCEYAETSNSNIWTIDHESGSMDLIGASGSSEGLNGLAYDDKTKTLYGASGTNLYTVDMTTGSASLVGAFGGDVMMIGIACDSSGNLYGEDLAGDSLYSIDKSTGVGTLIGSFGGGIDLNYAQDMAIDKDSDICYLAALTVHAGNEGALYTCDLSTGEATKVGNIGTELTEIVCFAIPYESSNPPKTPNPPSGPDEGMSGVEYTFTTSTTDPDGDDIYYNFDWDDGTTSDWVGPFANGTTGSASKIWIKGGDYQIKVKARDDNGSGETNWSSVHNIHITEAPNFDIGMIIGGFGKVSAPIKNKGDIDASDVQWTITLEGGAFIGKETTGMDDISAGAEITVTSGFILGLGKTSVTVTAEIPDGDSDSRTQSGFILIFFINIKSGG